MTGQSEKKKKESTGVNNLKERKEKKKANELQRTKKDSFLNYKETVIAIPYKLLEEEPPWEAYEAKAGQLQAGAAQMLARQKQAHWKAF